MKELHANRYKRLISIQITNVWGEITFQTKVSDINLFVGINGTGKTTFVKIIESVLTFDAYTLKEVDFKKCSLTFSDSSSVVCTKNVRKDSDIVHYLIKKDGVKIFDSHLDLSDYVPRIRKRGFQTISVSTRRGLFDLEDTDDVRISLSGLANVSWLSLERGNPHDVINDGEITQFGGSVDRKLQEVSRRLKAYQAELERAEKQELEHFREEVFKLMLFDEKLDQLNTLIYSLGEIKSPQALGEKKQLENIFKELGAFNKEIEQQMTDHFERMIGVIKKITSRYKKSKEITIDGEDVVVLTLYSRTQKMIDLSKELEKRKANIYLQKNLFEELLSDFCKSKSFSLFDSFHFVPLELSSSSKDKAIPIERCSSGEKQLLILFSEVLLQNRANSIFIADEPELSLHIDWQRKIIDALTKLNPNMQVVLATHAPEIVAKWRNQIIDMSEITFFNEV